MSIDGWLAWLAHATLASSVAIVVLALLRRPLLWGFGPGAVHAAWALVPLTVLAMALPARTVAEAVQPAAMSIDAGQVLALPVAQVDWQRWWLVAWAVGALVSAAAFWLRQRRFLRALGRVEHAAAGIGRAASVDGLPAAWGVLRPRIVLPADFEARFNLLERELMLCHERVHVRRGDLQANALVLLLRMLFWFNPLLHWAAWRFRRDQELACDARVLALHPGHARSYAQAMLKVQAVAWPLPLGCHWRGTAPLLERVAMLARPQPRRARRVLAWLVVPGLLGAGACLSWAAQPARVLFDRPIAALQTDAPAYPDAALREGISGEVVVRVDVDAGGRVTSARVMRSHPQGVFDAAALAAARAWRFDPKLERGRVAPGRVDVPIRFEAHDTGPGQAPASAPVAIDNIPPTFPRKAIDENLNGKVVVIADIDADGHVRQARVDSAEPVGLFEAAALKAVRSSRFAPAMRDGRPVPGQARQVYYWDTGMYAAPPPKGRQDAADYAWYVIDTQASLLKPEHDCAVVLPDPRPGMVGCGKRKVSRQ